MVPEALAAMEFTSDAYHSGTMPNPESGLAMARGGFQVVKPPQQLLGMESAQKYARQVREQYEATFQT
jgi:hypothetical protein